jgi:hypothetical protein
MAKHIHSLHVRKSASLDKNELIHQMAIRNLRGADGLIFVGRKSYLTFLFFTLLRRLLRVCPTGNAAHFWRVLAIALPGSCCH